jgi:hypothetical protein
VPACATVDVGLSDAKDPHIALALAAQHGHAAVVKLLLGPTGLRLRCVNSLRLVLITALHRLRRNEVARWLLAPSKSLSVFRSGGDILIEGGS